MPPKGKKAVQLQVTAETQEQWEALLAKGGLVVADVYSGWCGPCKAVTGLFRRLKNELGDDLLKLAIAKSDSIDSLEPYREHSEPTFLMFGGGELVAAVRGALGPELERTIKQQLSLEHEILEGKAERKPIVDEGLNQPEVVLEDDEPPEQEEAEPDIVPTRKKFTVVLIKPDAVQAGRADEIIEKLEESGMEILLKEERQLSREEAIEFYKQHEGSDNFEELVEFMTSGPCFTVVMTKGETGEGVVEELREMLGPTDVEQAQQEAPESLRAQFGTNVKMNALHASDSYETAARELAFFHPKFKAPWVAGTEPPIQRTIALIRPSAFAQHGESIIEKISEAGFEIAMQKELTLTKEQAAEFYKEHEEKEYFDSLCTNMSSGPMVALCLAREDAVEEWRKLLGPTDVETAKQEDPTSLRAQFSVEAMEAEEHKINALHGSSNEEEVQKDVQFFFPVEQTLAVIKPSAVAGEMKDEILCRIKEAGFSVSLSKETHLTKEMAEQFYSEHHGKEFFDDLTNFMSSGPSMVMVLSREDAIVGWRALMGPTDPEAAKESDPQSLRALFGQSVLDNAVHGSSTLEHAEKSIKAVFGDTSINPDGTIEGEEGGTEQVEES